MRQMIMLLSVVGCASGPAIGADVPPAMGDARRVSWELRHPKPVVEPRSLDEVADALRGDRAGEYAAAFRLTQQDQDRRAALLGAEVQVAWSEHEAMVADLVAREFRLAGAPVRGEIDPVLATLRQSSQAHLAQGRELARNAVDRGPGDDQGFRVMARAALDAHDWLAFDEAMSEIDALHTDGAELLFLLGREQLERYRDHGRTVRYLKAALVRDPGYVPAQVQLLQVRSSYWSEYRRLKVIAAEHQLVTLLGPLLERQHAWEDDRTDRDEVALRGL